MYHLATGHSVTDRQTDGSTMPIADHTLCSSTIGYWDYRRSIHHSSCCCGCCCDSPSTLLLSSVVQFEEVYNHGRVVP